MRRVAVVLALLALSPGIVSIAGQGPAAQTDLDALMAQVVARRDDNWKRLQQYVLDEQERVELRGPARTPIWGEKREYTWYLRDGFFVRSPLRFNGVEMSDGDRRKYEEDFLRRAKRRDQRLAERAASSSSRGAAATAPEPGNVQGMIQQLREPQFISSAYFLRFPFEPGRYAFVGRETLNGRQVLRVEYYPARLFSENANSRIERRQSQIAGHRSDEAYGDETERLMSKGSRVTLWIEPDLHQIVKYTFENVALDFLPMAWLFRVQALRASMMMSEAFAGVWLPRRVDVAAAVALALGRFDLTYSLEYTNYRQAEVRATIQGATSR